MINLIDLARKEMILLKQHVTPEEINKLDYSMLIPEQRDSCIYGQMTGDCFSRRATDLIKKCCPTMLTARNTLSNGIEEYVEPVPQEKVNLDDPFARINGYYSPIEVLISIYPSYGHDIIYFLKGLKDTI